MSRAVVMRNESLNNSVPALTGRLMTATSSVSRRRRAKASNLSCLDMVNRVVQRRVGDVQSRTRQPSDTLLRMGTLDTKKSARKDARIQPVEFSARRLVNDSQAPIPLTLSHQPLRTRSSVPRRNFFDCQYPLDIRSIICPLTHPSTPLDRKSTRLNS